MMIASVDVKHHGGWVGTKMGDGPSTFAISFSLSVFRATEPYDNGGHQLEDTNLDVEEGLQSRRLMRGDGAGCQRGATEPEADDGHRARGQ